MLKTIYFTLLLLLTMVIIIVSCGHASVKATSTNNFTIKKTIRNSEKIGYELFTGPESILFDKVDLNIVYTGVSDGSIRKFNLVTRESSIWAYIVPTLDESTRSTCGASVMNEQTCGRALGLAWDSNGDMLVADAYKGLLKISKSDTKNVQVLVDQYEGVPFKFTNSVVMLKDNRTVYFTDSSLLYNRNQFVATLVSYIPDGRLFKFDLLTNELTLILDDMIFANGIAVAEDESFLLINECATRKIRKYYLTGTKAGIDEIFIEDIGGYNDNIVSDGKGGFLVALYSYTSLPMSKIQEDRQLGDLFNKYVPPADTLSLVKKMGVVKRIDYTGRVVEVFEDITGEKASAISEAHEHDGYLYLCSVLNSYITRVDLITGVEVMTSSAGTLFNCLFLLIILIVMTTTF